MATQPSATAQVPAQTRPEASGSLINGDSIQFEYADDNNEHSSTPGKKKKKKKKSKSKKTAPNVIGRDIDLDDPDFEYPDSRILKQNSNGDVIVQSLEPPKKAKKASSASSSFGTVKKSTVSDALLPGDPEELNFQLKEYWQSLTTLEKRNLLNLERDAVFKVMSEQQKITCSCTVCGRKREIIEHELKKLYDTYFEGIESHEQIIADLFNNQNEQPTAQQQSQDHNRNQNQYQSHSYQQQQKLQHQNQRQPQTQRSSQKSPAQNLQVPEAPPTPFPQHPPPQNLPNQPAGSTKVDARRNGIMSVAEDLLRNDGRKFLEMMEKLAETRIQRQAQYLNRPEIIVTNSNKFEEEENQDYSDNLDDDESEVEEALGDQESLVSSEDRCEYAAGFEALDEAISASLPNDQTSTSFLELDLPSEDEEDDGDYVFEETDIDDLEDEEFEDEEDLAIFKEEVVDVLKDTKALLELFNLEYDNKIAEYDPKLRKELANQVLAQQYELVGLKQQLHGHTHSEDVDEDHHHDHHHHHHHDSGIEDQGDHYEDESDEEHDHHHLDHGHDHPHDDGHHFHGHSHSCGHDHSHDHSHSHSHHDENYDDDDEVDVDEFLNEEDDDLADDDEDEEENVNYSDNALDEEQQLEEGRAMLQLCTTKMLRQSLLESFKKKKQEEQLNALLSELDEESQREKKKEEKKQREREKKREKKRLLQQEKERERLEKEERERQRKFEEEQERRLKTEEGRRRKEEAEAKKKKEEEEKRAAKEKARLEKEAKKKAREEARLKEEEAKRAKEDAIRQKNAEERSRLEEAERLRIQKEQEAIEAERLRIQKEQEAIEAKRLQEQIRREEEEDERQRQIYQQQKLQTERPFSQSSAPGGFKSQPLESSQTVDNVFQSTSPFSTSVFPASSVGQAPLGVNKINGIPPPPPPGFSIDLTANGLNGAGQGSNNFFSPRLLDSSFQNGSSIGSPWNNKMTLPTANYNSFLTPSSNHFQNGFQNSISQFGPENSTNGFGNSTLPPLSQQSNVLQQPQPRQSVSSQIDNGINGNSEIDLLASNLASTKFDDFIGGSKVWCSTGTNQDFDSKWSSNIQSSLWGPTGSSPSQPIDNLGTNSIPGSLLYSNSVSKSFPQSITPQVPSVLTSNSPANVDQLIKNYQSEIFAAYSFAESSHLDGGFIRIEDLYSNFNSIQSSSSSAVNFALFTSIIQSPCQEYNFEQITDDLGNVRFVKITPYSISRSGSTAASGFGTLNSLDNGFKSQSLNLMHGISSWGSSF